MKSCILLIWKLIDPIYYACTRLKHMENSVFRVRLTRYKGKTMILSDGSKITKNDLLVRIHLHNVRIFEELHNVKSELKKTRLLYRQVEHSLPLIAVYINQHRKKEEIKGVIGITMINNGVSRLGLEPVEITNRAYKWWKSLIQVPIYILSAPHPSLKQFRKKNPNYLFMSKDLLLSKYDGLKRANENLPTVPM